MRGCVTVGVFALVLLVAVGCTGEDEPSAAEGEVRLSAAGDPAPQPLGDAVTLDGEPVSLRQDEVSVEVPSGAMASEALLRFGQSLGTVDGEVFGRPVSVEVTEPLELPLELRWEIAEVTEQQRASIVPLRWDEDLEVWAIDESEDTQLRIEGDELVLVASEFSWRSWSWAADFGQLVGERTGSRRSGPSCDGELPSWVTNVVDPGAGTSAAAIQVCFEPDGDDTITVRVVNNRPFTQRLEMTEGDQQWAWTWTGAESYDVSAAVNVAAREVFETDTAFLLPPLSETAVGINRPEGGGSHFISATAIADHNTFLVDGIDYLLGLVTPGGFESELLNEFVGLVYECGGSAALSGTDFSRVSTAIVDVMASCVNEVMTSSSGYGARFDAARIDAMAAASPERQAQLVKMNRSLHQLARAAHLLKAGELAFYFTDQLQNAYIGHLALSISATGRAGELGDWTAACDDLAADSNRLFRNLTLRDPFYDTSRELWQFDELEPAAVQAVQPLQDCNNEYLAELVALLPDDWADRRAADMVALEVRALTGDSSDGPCVDGSGPPERICLPGSTVGLLPSSENPPTAFSVELWSELMGWNHATYALFREGPADEMLLRLGVLTDAAEARALCEELATNLPSADVICTTEPDRAPAGVEESQHLVLAREFAAALNRGDTEAAREFLVPDIAGGSDLDFYVGRAPHELQECFVVGNGAWNCNFDAPSFFMSIVFEAGGDRISLVSGTPDLSH